jgi:hypothetical protein
MYEKNSRNGKQSGKSVCYSAGNKSGYSGNLLVVQNESNSFQGNVSVINETMHFTIVADNGITGLYPHDIAIVIIGAASGEKVEDFVVIGMRVLTDTSAGGQNHVVEQTALAIQLFFTVEDFAHFRFTVSVADALEFHSLLVFCSDH